MLARLQHDNIIRVEELTTLHDHTAVVMEYVRGLTLDRVLNQEGPMPVEVALQICHKVADALDAAFNQVPPGLDKPLRVVHRDIKPSNVMLSVRGEVKVLDFGTARAEIIDRQAETGSVTPGSPLYMAPERFDGLARGAEVDVYGLGCCLYELITGEPLGRLSVHPARHEKEVAEKVQALAPADLQQGLQLAMVRSLIQRAVSYEPAHRPTAAEFRALCASAIRRLPGHRVTKAQYASSVIAPLYAKRKRLPALPLEGTLDPKALEEAVDEVKSVVVEDPDTEVSAIEPLPATIPVTVDPPVSRRKPIGLALAVLVALGLVGSALVSVLSRTEPTPAVETEAVVPEEVEETTAPVSTEVKPQPVAPPAAEPAPVVEPEPEPEPEREREPEPAAPAAEPEPAASPPPKAAPQKKASPKKPAAPPPEPVAEPAPVTAAPVEVRIVSAPAGAKVTIGGKSIHTPGEMPLTPGSHTAKVTFPDGVGGRCQVTVAEGTRLVFRGSGGLKCP